MIRVETINVFLTEKGDEFIILLRGTDDKRTLPVSIGQLEAQSIATQLYHVDFPRPLTHDLFKTALERNDCRVSRVIISDIIDSTFYARLFLEKSGEILEIDSRPSDAIALALRFSAPIFIDERVMDESGVILPGTISSEAVPMHSDDNREPPAPEGIRKLLLRAIEEERYEDAAALRDTLNNLSKSN